MVGGPAWGALCVAAALLAAAPGGHAQELELLWEPMPSGNYCLSLPPTKKGSKKLPRFVSDAQNYVCSAYIGEAFTLSPEEYAEVAQGKITKPELKVDDCDEKAGGYKCGGTLELELAKQASVRFMFTAGKEEDSSYEFHAPVGPVRALFSLQSAACTGDVQTIICDAVNLPSDWAKANAESIKMEIGKGNLKFIIDVYSFRGGVTERINEFGLTCKIDAAALPAGCGAKQDWTFQLQDRLDLGSWPASADEYHKRIVQQEGVSMTHPFNKSQLVVLKGLPVSADPCNEHEDLFKCNNDGIDQGAGPCRWNSSVQVCQIQMAPEIAPATTTIGIDDATFTFDFPGWPKSSGFEKVRAFYWTYGNDPNDTAVPRQPDPDDPTTSKFYTCKVPCSLPWSAPGNYTISVIAHVQASIAGQFRAVFYSAVATKSYIITPNPTPIPTPVPTPVPTPIPTLGQTAAPTDAPDTNVPDTEVPMSAPPTDAPTPMPEPTLEPTPPPINNSNWTPEPIMAPPAFADPCEALTTQGECAAPCSWVFLTAKCKFAPIGPIVKTDAQRACATANGASHPQCILAIGEKVPIVYVPNWDCSAATNCTVHETRYYWCDYHNKNDTNCFTNDFENWKVRPPGEWGLEIHLTHCEDEAQCGLIKLRAVSRVSSNIGNAPPTVTAYTAVTESEVFLHAELGNTVAPPTMAPANGSPPSDSNIGAVVGVIIGVLVILALAAGLVYFLWKKRKQRDEEALAELDETDDDDDEFLDMEREVAEREAGKKSGKRGGKVTELEEPLNAGEDIGLE